MLETIQNLDIQSVVEIYNSNSSQSQFVQAMTEKYFDSSLISKQQEELNKLKKEYVSLKKEQYTEIQKDLSSHTENVQEIEKQILQTKTCIIQQYEIIEEADRIIKQRNKYIKENMIRCAKLEDEIRYNTNKINEITLNIANAKERLLTLVQKRKAQGFSIVPIFYLNKDGEGTECFLNNVDATKLNDYIRCQQKTLELIVNHNADKNKAQQYYIKENELDEKSNQDSKQLITQAEAEIKQLITKRQSLQQNCDEIKNLIAKRQKQIEDLESSNNYQQDLSVVVDINKEMSDKMSDKQKQIDVCNNQLQELRIKNNSFQNSIVVCHGKLQQCADKKDNKIHLDAANSILDKIKEKLYNLKQYILVLMTQQNEQTMYQSQQKLHVELVLETAKKDTFSLYLQKSASSDGKQQNLQM